MAELKPPRCARCGRAMERGVIIDRADAGKPTTPDWLEGVPEKETWEYRGPLRAVLRVDGKFGDVPGFGFTTRYTFYRGHLPLRGLRLPRVLRPGFPRRAGVTSMQRFAAPAAFSPAGRSP